jgi:hypothetical protein
MFKNVLNFLKKIFDIFTKPPSSLHKNHHFPIYPSSLPSRIYLAVAFIWLILIPDYHRQGSTILSSVFFLSLFTFHSSLLTFFIKGLPLPSFIRGFQSRNRQGAVYLLALSAIEGFYLARPQD